MVQELVTRAWGSRLVQSFWGSLIGLVLIIGSFAVIFWNEGRCLHMAQALHETKQALVVVSTKPIDPQNNLRPVYFSGVATTNEILQDSLLGVSQQALLLIRTVEMYQWKQHSETQTQAQLGGPEREITKYSYSPTWSQHLIASSEFKDPQGHQNPAQMPLQSKTLQAKKVKVGDFILPATLVSKMQGSTILDLSRMDLRPLQAKLHKPLQHLDYSIYMGKNPQTPEIGDLKITVSQVLPQTVSVIAQQKGETVQAYMTQSGQMVALIMMGHGSPEQIIHQAETDNKTLTWVIRFLSFLMMVFGLSLLLRPIVILAAFVPWVGSLVGLGAGLLAFTGGLFLWSLATAIAWFIVRPLWSLGLIVFVLLLNYIIFAYYEKRVK